MQIARVRHNPDRGRRFFAGLVAATFAVGLIGSERAHGAAMYTVVQCFDDHGVSQGSGTWSSGGPNPGRVAADNNCGQNGGLGSYTLAANVGNKTYGAWSWSAPAGAYIAKTQVHHKSREGNGWQAYYSLDVVGDGDGVRNLGSADEWTYGQYLIDARRFSALLQCKVTTCDDGPQHLYIRRIWFDLVDLVTPRFQSITGPLVAGGVRHGRENLTVETSDQGSGLATLSIEVNGALVHTRSLRQSCDRSSNDPVFGTRMRPCPASDQATIQIETDDGPGPWREGANSLRTCVQDFSGQTECTTRSVVVDNTCPSSGADPAASLSGGVVQRGVLRSIASLRSNQDVELAGTLRTAAGEPVDDAIICVYETDDVANATPQLVRTLRTKNGGDFAALLRPGPSRRFRFAYRYNSLLIEDRASVQSSVLPILKVGRKRIRNGNTLRFHGRIPGPANANRVVALQVRLPKKWRTFKAPRTNDRGRFRAAYRFINSGTFRYTFRAVVKRQRGYPYEPGVSRNRRVLVLG